MTTAEAMQAVKKATKLSYKDIGMKELDTILAALRAIAPGGPLVVMPRELTKEMIWAAHQEIDWCRNTQNTAYPRHETQKENIGGEPIGTFCEDDIRDAYRAMIAEGEK